MEIKAWMKMEQKKFSISRCLFVFLALCCPISTIFAQHPQWLSHDSLHIMIGRTAMDILETDSSGRWVVSPGMTVIGFQLRQDQITELDSWGARQWKSHLVRKRTSYITNCLLYALNEKDATLLNVVSKESWEKLDRKEDVIFWRAFLQESKLPSAKILAKTQ